MNSPMKEGVRYYWKCAFTVMEHTGIPVQVLHLLSIQNVIYRFFFNRGFIHNYTSIRQVVYRLKSVGALEMKFVAPMPEQSNIPTKCISLSPPEPLLKCIVMVPICSAMGATNLKFWVLSR